MGGTGPGNHEAATNATTDRTTRDQHPRSALNATYYGRWSTAPSKNKNPITGRWSLPVSMTVAFSQNPKGDSR